MDKSPDRLPTSRRNLLKGAGTLLATAGFTGGLKGQTQAPPPAATAVQGGILQRPFPRTNEMVPAIGLGTFMTFDALPGQPRNSLFEVMGDFWNAGGRVIDTSPLYGMAEVSVGHFASQLGINDQIFVSNKAWVTGDYLADDRQGERSLALSGERLWRSTIDVMQCHSLVNVDVVVPLMRAWKKEGRIRYLGVTHYQTPYFEPLLQWVERGNLDVVQVNYSIHTRLAEEKIIPAAADRGTAVAVNMPFEKGRLHKIVEGHALPDFAKEFGAQTWSSFFLKWILSHPAVTYVLPATTNPVHLAENMAALRGPLPDREMRQRMVRHMEGIPGFDRLAEMPWYPGKTFDGAISRAQRRLRERA